MSRVPSTRPATWLGVSSSPRRSSSRSGSSVRSMRLMPREQLVRRGPGEADRDPSHPSVADQLCLVASSVDVRKDRPSPLEVLLASGRQVDPASRTSQQLNPELGLELLDLLRQRRLRDVQALRRATEMALLGDCDEVAQVSQLHGANLPASRTPSRCEDRHPVLDHHG